MHPIIEDISRVKAGEPIRLDVLRRWQHVLSHEVQPLLDERQKLVEENAALRQALAGKQKPAA